MAESQPGSSPERCPASGYLMYSVHMGLPLQRRNRAVRIRCFGEVAEWSKAAAC